MNSSGIKRGLATTAVAALAVTGLPFLATSASADSITSTLTATETEIFSQYSGQASVQNDGVNTTVHLLAGGGSDVQQIRFEYGPALTPTTIATVSRSNGAFSTEWAPPVALYGTPVIIRAVALSSVGTEIGTPDEQIATVGANSPAIDIANAAGSALGIFPQPYGVEAAEAGSVQDGIDHSTAQGVVNGTTSGAGNVTLRDLSTGSAPRPAVAPSAADANGIRTFKGTVNFQDYVLDTTAPIVNEAVVGADNGSDDAEVVNLEKQTITTVTAAATPAAVPNGGTSTGVVTVTDAAGRPVAGAQVIYDANNNGTWDYDGVDNTQGTADDEKSIYTNANGQANFTGLTGSAAGTAYNFYVNTTGGDAFEPALDFKRTITVTSFAQVATTLTATSKDGNAFDVNENATGDLSAKLVDQNGSGIQGQTISYSLSIVPFVAPTPPATVPAPATGTATTDANGVANIPFSDLGSGTYTLKTFVERDGTPGQSAGDLAGSDLVFKAGDSTLAFVDAPSATAIAGTTDTFDATLKLSDGTPLPGRLVTFTYGPTGNVVVAAQANQPAGTTRTSDTQATDTTDATGTVSVALSDPATPDQAELNGQLDADTSTNTIGNAAEDAADLDVDFVDGTPNARTSVVIATDTATNKPGTVTNGSVTVTEDADNNPATAETAVVGLAVTLTVDKGFFTDGTPDPAPAVGADQGEFKSLGQTITVVTGAGGVANFQTAMERNTDFDDDGAAEAIVTAKTGTFSDTEDYDYSSATPLNGGEVVLTQLPDADQDNPVDPTRTNDDVAFDVYVTDQFGNKVGGATVNLTDNSADATVTPASVVSDFQVDDDFTVSSSESETVTVTATWTAPANKYVADGLDAGTVPDAGAPTTETLTDNVTVEFYEVSFADSTFTITSTPEGTAPVGSAVTETVKVVDQNGNPVEGLTVEFFRTGPDAGGGDANVVRTTNANGEAFYTFIGSSAGTAQITAQVTDGTDIETLTDTVTFGNGPVPPIPPIEAKLFGKNFNAKFDRLVVNAPARATGAAVRLFKLVAGKRVQVGKVKALNNKGDAVFTVADRNGNRITRYVAVVNRTKSSTSDTTNQRKVR